MKNKKSGLEVFFKRITELGIREVFTIQQKRSVILSNLLALIFAFSSLLLLFVPQNFNIGGFIESGIIIVISTIPLLLNYLGYTKISRPYLCWIPVWFIMIWMIGGMREAEQVEVVTYGGLRIYLLALSCVPYLLFESHERLLFFTSVLPSFICIVFFDPILDLAGVGYSLKGVQVSGYNFAQMRTLIAYFIINGSCFSLKLIISNNDRFNKKLLSELNLKNQLLKAQSESELKRLNDQLMANLEVLERRELAILKSQQMANLGSWDYDLPSNTIYWSDEMYDIFGVDKSFDLTRSDLMIRLFGNPGVLVQDAFSRLLLTGETYEFTLQTKTPIGYTKWVRMFGYPIYSNNVIVSASGIVHDVTRYKESEELIRANEKNYRSLFEQASDAIMIHDFKGNFVDVNESLNKMLGYTKEQFLNLNVSDIIDSEQLKINPVRFDLLRQGQQIFNERKLLRNDGSFIYAEVNIKMFDDNRVMAIARDVSERKKMEQEKEYARYLLKERIKELTTLYRVGQILTQDRKLIPEVLQEIVLIIPSGWQFPSICAAQITHGLDVYSTSNYKETKFKQQADFKVGETTSGKVEVVYLEEKPEEVEGVFLFEERNLINAIAEMLQIYLVRKNKEEELNKSQANLRATINNTEVLIWSVDRDFRALTFNEPFARHVKENYNTDIIIGSKLLPGNNNPEQADIAIHWNKFYLQALAGEVVKVEELHFGRNFMYSLSPIIEGNKVIGVSVFADDITDQKIKEKALVDANKKIGEFRLTALRSVMNPHFIFNALNSIQFFITKNDRLNAINYLSTFSKLIRGILTNSVSNTIKLSEELELLKHYINLEMLRFENKFSFELAVDDKLDLDSIQIPSLLVQPYVENAILHGLYNKTEAGKLIISVREVESAVLFEIEDDGVGRVEAAKLREQNFPKHKSMGTALTEERLRLINDYNNVSLETLDLMEGTTATGTRVRIWIKV